MDGTVSPSTFVLNSSQVLHVSDFDLSEGERGREEGKGGKKERKGNKQI